MSNNSLQNIENYNTNYNNTTTEIFTKYIGLIVEYLIQITDTLYVKDVIYYKYIISKGIETLSHVFNLLLLYTKNLEITYYYGQKAFYYYTEFIGQIVQIEDEHQSFLQLNCKDASLFVYKKTIFEINNEYKKEFTSTVGTCSITESTKLLIELYNNCIVSIINSYNGFEFSHIFSEIDNKLSKIIANILNISLNIDKNIYNEKIHIILYFYKNIKVDNINKFVYLEYFTKKLQKYKISLENIKIKFSNDNNEYKLLKYTPQKYISWLYDLNC